MIPGPSTHQPQSTPTPAQGNRKQSASKESSGQPASWRDGDSNASTTGPRGTDAPPQRQPVGIVRNLLGEFNEAAENQATQQGDQ
jgi:hypothetical protein